MFLSVVFYLWPVLMYRSAAFCVKVLGSAIEPGIEKEVMLGEAQDLLDVSLLRNIPNKTSLS